MIVLIILILPLLLSFFMSENNYKYIIVFMGLIGLVGFVFKLFKKK